MSQYTRTAFLRMPRDYEPARDFGRPFEDVAKTFKIAPPRSINIVKRDLSYMSRAHDVPAENQWAPKLAQTKALDFSEAKFRKHKKVSPKTARPVWTGCGGHLRRFNTSTGNEVYHDTAYWLPLLLYYTRTQR